MLGIALLDGALECGAHWGCTGLQENDDRPLFSFVPWLVTLTFGYVTRPHQNVVPLPEAHSNSPTCSWTGTLRIMAPNQSFFLKVNCLVYIVIVWKANTRTAWSTHFNKTLMTWSKNSTEILILGTRGKIQQLRALWSFGVNPSSVPSTHITTTYSVSFQWLDSMGTCTWES